MDINLIQKLNPSAFTAVFITEENLVETKALLPQNENLLKLLSVASAEAEKVSFFFDGVHSFTFYGLGKAAELKVEKFRGTICNAIKFANQQKITEMQLAFANIAHLKEPETFAIALGEIPTLSNYQFVKYKKDPKSKNSLTLVDILTDDIYAEHMQSAAINADIVCIARDWVNEPPNVLNAVTFAERFTELGDTYGFTTTVFDKDKIEDLKMGGLLAVNAGSQIPPTFSILEYKPEFSVNMKPIILVGKGLTFDTGGLSLKPTPASMDSMKSDMAGGAVAACAVATCAANKLPVHIIALIPSTDNRPGENAYTPNDIITMYDGTTVEVLNTDAEGRMILADALAYAKELDPELVVSLATLTGSAVVAVGQNASPYFSTADENTNKLLREAGERNFERLIEFPLWEDYAEQLKSDCADLKNIGGKYAGSITAAKFLQNFIKETQWIHIDIAGPSYLDTASGYRGKNGTGMGVRLLYDFLSNS